MPRGNHEVRHGIECRLTIENPSDRARKRWNRPAPRLARLSLRESCFGTIKTELEMTEYDHQQTAQREIEDYLAYYNHDRKHSALGYLTLQQFELTTYPSN